MSIISTDKAPAAIGPYSQAAVVEGRIALVSGCIGLKVNGGFPDGGIEAQTRQALQNLKAIVEESGGTLADVSKTTVLLAGSMRHYAAVNKIYNEFFPENPPARAAFAVAGLPAGALIEIDCIVALQPLRSRL